MKNTLTEMLNTGPKTVAELVTLTGKSDTTVRKALAEMQDVVKAGKTFSLSATPAPSSNGQGRPRPEHTQQRDQQVLAALRQAGKISTEDLAKQLELKQTLVYISLHRLRSAGAIEKVPTGSRVPVWQVTS